MDVATISVVDVAIVSGVDVATAGVLVAVRIVDVAAVVAAVAALLLLKTLVGFEYEERREFHVLPRLAGIA